MKSATALFIVGVTSIALNYWLITTTLWTFSTTWFVLLWMVLTGAFYFTLKSYKNLRGFSKLWGGLVAIFSFVLSALLMLFLLLQLVVTGLGGTTHMLTSNSPDKRYTIDFHYFDAGAMGSFGVRAELDGPLWFKKAIYYERHAMEANVEWLDHETVVINGNELNLTKGDVFGYIENE